MMAAAMSSGSVSCSSASASVSRSQADVEIVVARLDLLAREAAPAAFLALILALCPAVRIVAVGLLEVREVLDRQRAGLAEGGHVGPHVIDPDRLGVGLVGLAALEKQHVGLDALRIEDAGRQPQDGVQVAKVHQPRAQPAAGVVLEQHVVGHHHRRRARRASGRGRCARQRRAACWRCRP